MRIRLLLFFVLSSIFCNAQNIDSLWTVYKSKAQTDTARLNALTDISSFYKYNDPDTAIILAQEEIQLAARLPSSIGKKWISKAYKISGVAYMNKSNYPKALENYLQSLKICEEIKDKRGIGNCYQNIGLLYYSQTDYPMALEYGLKALKIREEMNDKKGIGNCCQNIGIVYQKLSNWSKALEYDLKALDIYKEINDIKGIGFCYRNIGTAYETHSDFDKALDYYQKALKISHDTDDKKAIAGNYNNLGGIYDKLSNYKSAILYSDSALRSIKGLSDINQERIAYENMSIAYSKTGNYKEAYEDHVKFKSLTDSIFNADNSKQLGDLKTQFEVDKKETELKAKSAAQQTINAEEKKRQQLIIYAVAGVLLIVVLFSFFLFQRFRLTNKQKKIIEKQKILVDEAFDQLREKNKEVMDSIYYARRIQSSLITSEKYIEKSLNRLMKKDK